MAVENDTADWVAGQVSELGLEFQGTEISGNGYSRLTPTYDPAAGGVADISSTLAFDGPENADVDAVRYIRDGSVWFTRNLTEPEAFNSDGRIDLSSAPIEVGVNGS